VIQLNSIIFNPTYIIKEKAIENPIYTEGRRRSTTFVDFHVLVFSLKNHKLLTIPKMSITSPAPSGRVNHVNNFDFLSFCFSPKSFSPHQMVVVTVIIISVLLPMRNRIMSQHYTLQFIAAFHNDKVIFDFSFTHIVFSADSFDLMHNTYHYHIFWAGLYKNTSTLSWTVATALPGLCPLWLWRSLILDTTQIGSTKIVLCWWPQTLRHLWVSNHQLYGVWTQMAF